jgi:hypothetical protein
MREILASTPLILTVLVATVLTLALAGLAGEIVRFIRESSGVTRPGYRQWRTLGRSRAEAFRLALWRE